MSGEISKTIAGEGSLLLISLLFGLVLMLVYDILRIFRHIVRHKTFFTALEDILYWLFCAVGIFAMLYQENDGLLRWFVLGGVAIGMLFENYFISPSIVSLFVKIIRIWLKIIKKFLHIFGKPLKKIYLFFRKELKKIRKAIKIGLSKD